MNRFDVVVIGGGIHGVGVAQAVVAAGYSCAVIEQHALAWGTSSRSSKLIHGGLRYLESAQFSVVRECLRERAILLRLAPDLVRLKPFIIPVYRDTSRRPWKIRLGLTGYALLSGLDRAGSFGSVPRQQWDTLDGLALSGLQQVFRYWDAQTDDAMLTRAVMASAQAMGAELFSPAEFLGADIRTDGCAVRIRQHGHDSTLVAKVVVNAAGPWVNQVLSKMVPLPPVPRMELVQGSHLILKVPLSENIYYLEAPRDKRAVFVMPWQGNMLLGTTETPYLGDPAKVTVLADEQAYLIETFVHYFPQYRAAPAEILSSFAGLRVLPAADSAAFGRSRETLLIPDREINPRLVSIYGGKLTAYRATAQRVLARILPALPQRKGLADTTELPLSPV